MRRYTMAQAALHLLFLLPVPALLQTRRVLPEIAVGPAGAAVRIQPSTAMPTQPSTIRLMRGVRTMWASGEHGMPG